MDFHPAGSRPSTRASAEYFTGTVWQDPVLSAPDPARVVILKVTFEPGARTNWHTHPLGQTLHVVSGCGLFQTWGEAARVIRPGDTIWIPPGEKHWHGAGAETAMCHLAVQERLDGEAAEWLDAVSEEDYAAACDVRLPGP